MSDNCPKCGYPLVAGTCDNLCRPDLEPNSVLKKIENRLSGISPHAGIGRLLNEAKLEIERLLRGEFTREEVMNFCHKLSETVPECEFAMGCEEYRRYLYYGEPYENQNRQSETPSEIEADQIRAQSEN